MSYWAKTMEGGKKLETPLIILRYMGSGMYERCGSELERPYLPPKGKEETYKHKRSRILGRRESEGFIVPIMAMEQNIA